MSFFLLTFPESTKPSEENCEKKHKNSAKYRRSIKNNLFTVAYAISHEEQIMIRYRLDDLGWYQFEWLIQSLFKAELGIGVEAWGERRDYGIDAYCEGPLQFPSKHITTEGPFVFQAKFIENANAAGADISKAITRAVKAESVNIKNRIGRKKWQVPRHYTLVTNAFLSADERGIINKTIKSVIVKAKVHSLGGNDICDLLDNNPALRRAFPQLLSLRDLDQLLYEAVSKKILEKSSSALEAAREIVPVFVPTDAYEKTWKVLKDHYFCVLEGPPEMGKTAIAWMIAIAQLSYGWQAIACDNPDDLFGAYLPNTAQVFVADDAFGRTEYDPARGKHWETALPRLLKRLNVNHWLIWTSRKHILERALRSMDLQGSARNFPSPAAVLVDATKLSTKEKALILYRHARAEGLEERAKQIVRRYAKDIVNDGSFTPERIRRFVKDRLPNLLDQMSRNELNEESVHEEVLNAIRNPTDRMRKSFKALPGSHKWMLVALLEGGRFLEGERLRDLYETHCPVDVRKPFHEVIEELSESFVRLR